MTELSNEILMAYADGVLDTVAAEQVETALTEHPEYRQRVHIFRMTRHPVQRAFDEVMDEPVPDKAVAVLRRAVGFRFGELGLGALRAMRRRGPQQLSEIAVAIAARLWRYARARGHRSNARLPGAKQTHERAPSKSGTQRRLLAGAGGRQPRYRPGSAPVAVKLMRTVFHE